jgi:hypothetical protein
VLLAHSALLQQWVLQVVAGQLSSVPQAPLPLHSTSHDVVALQCTPPLHAAAPSQSVTHVAPPQVMPPFWQTFWPSHQTSHVLVALHWTPAAHAEPTWHWTLHAVPPHVTPPFWHVF